MGGVAVAGLGLLCVVSVLTGGGPVLRAVREVLLGLFGLGWIVPAGCAIGLGALWIWPRPPALHPAHLLPGAIGVVTTLGVLSIASAPAGGEVGRLVATLVVGPTGPAGGLLVLLLVTLASLIAALRFSLGAALLALASAGRVAYAERQRLRALVRRRPPEAGQGGAPRPAVTGTGEVALPEEFPVPAPAPNAIWVPDHLEERALAQARLTAQSGEPPAPPAVAPRPAAEGDLPVVGGEWDDEPAVDWKLPPLSLLDSASAKRERQQEEIKRNVKIIEGTLATFGVQARVIGVNSGPAVTQYELQPAAGVPVRRVVALQNDLSLALAAAPLRIEAPIPGKSAIGIEVPNKAMTLVTLREVVESAGFRSPDRVLAVALGNDVGGQPMAADLTRMPHLLIAGATGQGKSVCINALICSLLLQATPERLRLVMIDPKRVELQGYNGLPHLVVPVIVEPHQAAAALRWAVTEMERRYRLLAQEGARNLAVYNERARAAAARCLPYLVIVVDELADLMMVAAGEIEELICRIAQLARAVGIHLVIATQRPSTDIITGLIKANVPSRIAFAVGSQVDSRVILDAAGAEKLLGRGDMLYQPVDAGKPTRLQGAFISDREVEAIVGFWRSQGEPRYLDEVLEAGPPGSDEPGRGERRLDPLFARAARAVAAEGAASVSLIQRKFNVGYSRAGRIVDQLAEHRVIGGYQGSKSREVLMTLPDVDELLERLGLEG
ncbi:MAG TPA: DNA translocase FtsK [Candidatus Dormibacteraeota bacterium]|nr:DNA translocase FtsK [Candidatus Dormibacteraeota bacterium]